MLLAVQLALLAALQQQVVAAEAARLRAWVSGWAAVSAQKQHVACSGTNGAACRLQQQLQATCRHDLVVLLLLLLLPESKKQQLFCHVCLGLLVLPAVPEQRAGRGSAGTAQHTSAAAAFAACCLRIAPQQQLLLAALHTNRALPRPAGSGAAAAECNSEKVGAPAPFEHNLLCACANFRGQERRTPTSAVGESE